MRPLGRRVLLTGGIGSGKSAVGRAFASLGATVVDADDLAREVVAPGTPGLAAVAAEFGRGVLTRDGALDRAALAEIVFADRSRLDALEAIVHPLVRQLAARRLAAVPERSVGVYEVPVMRPEDRAPGWCVVVVDAPEEVRVARLCARGLGEDQITARLAQQPTRAEWLALADVVVDNSGDEAALASKVSAVWAEIASDTGPEGSAAPVVGDAD